VPVSKKRKKKKSYSPPPPKSKVAAPKKKKITTQQIIIYIISALMILSLALGFLLSGSSTQAVPTPAPQDNILLETPAPAEDGEQVEEPAEPASDQATPEN
jgi:hypothetical protein